MQLLVDVMGTVLNVMFALVMNESTKIVFPNVLVLFSISLTELFLFYAQCNGHSGFFHHCVSIGPGSRTKLHLQCAQGDGRADGTGRPSDGRQSDGRTR